MEYVVQKILTGMGLKVRKIEETSSLTPDLFVTDIDDQKYIVEVKTLTTTRMNPIANDENPEIIISKGNHAANSTLSGKIRHAFNQLNAYNKSGDSFNIVWLVLQTNENRFLWNNVKRNLYGTKWVSDTKLTTGKLCFYANYSDFYRFSEVIDGVIISDLQDCEFLLTSISSKYEELKNSVLAKHMGKAVFDPIYELKKNDYYLYLEPSELSSNNETLKRIKDKYGLLNPWFTSMNHITFTGSNL